jgi:aquaporin NIP
MSKVSSEFFLREYAEFTSGSFAAQVERADMEPIPLRKKVIAEALGTFGLVFAGTSAIVVNSDGAVSHVGVALTFGLVVFAMIAAIGDVSGAHINPAVTVGFCLAKRFPLRAVGPYIAAQCLGALLASIVVRVLFWDAVSLGETIPAGPVLRSWLLELILTSALMFVILSVSTGASEKGITAGLAIGAVVALEALFAGPISGASMNPARSLGPAIISGHMSAVWIYLTAPFVGAVIAIAACRCVREETCCSASTGACV